MPRIRFIAKPGPLTGGDQYEVGKEYDLPVDQCEKWLRRAVAVVVEDAPIKSEEDLKKQTAKEQQEAQKAGLLTVQRIAQREVAEAAIPVGTPPNNPTGQPQSTEGLLHKEAPTAATVVDGKEQGLTLDQSLDRNVGGNSYAVPNARRAAAEQAIPSANQQRAEAAQVDKPKVEAGPQPKSEEQREAERQAEGGVGRLEVDDSKVGMVRADQAKK